jgi:hypothetical protein
MCLRSKINYFMGMGMVELQRSGWKNSCSAADRRITASQNSYFVTLEEELLRNGGIGLPFTVFPAKPS